MMRTVVELTKQVKTFPQLRFMGSKYRLLPWFCDVLSELNVNTALDGFSGSASVGFLLKSMGKQVISNDRLHFSHTIATAIVENSGTALAPDDVEALLHPNPRKRDFIERTFRGIFFEEADLEF